MRADSVVGVVVVVGSAVGGGGGWCYYDYYWAGPGCYDSWVGETGEGDVVLVVLGGVGVVVTWDF